MSIRSILAAFIGSTMVGSTVAAPAAAARVVDLLPMSALSPLLDGTEGTSQDRPKADPSPSRPTPPERHPGLASDDHEASSHDAERPQHRGHAEDGDEHCEGKRGKGHDAAHHRGHGPPAHARGAERGRGHGARGDGPPPHARGHQKARGPKDRPGHRRGRGRS